MKDPAPRPAQAGDVVDTRSLERVENALVARAELRRETKSALALSDLVLSLIHISEPTRPY